MWNTWIVSYRRIFCGLVGGASLVWLTTGLIAQEKEKTDKAEARKKAKETALQLLKAVKAAVEAKDAKSLMKLVDVPWFSDGQWIIKDREELKKHLKKIWIDRITESPFPEFSRIATYGEIRDLFQDERKRKLADQVFAKDDWAVFVREKGKEEEEILFMRILKGKARVIGIGG